MTGRRRRTGEERRGATGKEQQTMHEDELPRGSVQRAKTLAKKDAGPPLPLPYHVNGKYTESVGAGVEKVEAEDEEDGAPRPASELKAMRKALSVIGDPLPLDYLSGEEVRREGVEEAEKMDAKPLPPTTTTTTTAVPTKKLRTVRLADLGQPLPLKYNPAFHRSLRRVETPRQQQQQQQQLAPQVSPRMANAYDFGSPLPLEYADEQIETEEYLRWKSSATAEPFDEWKESRSRIPSGGHPKEADADTSHEETTNVIGINEGIEDRSPQNAVEKPSEEAVRPTEGLSSTENPSDTDTDTDIEPEPAMDHKIQRYVLHEDFRGLEDRLEDAEFRLKLMRYTRRLKRQYDFLCKVLHSTDATADLSTATASPSPCPSPLPLPAQQKRTVYVQSAAVSTGVFLLLCTISYFLAD